MICEHCGLEIKKGEEYRKHRVRFYHRTDECLIDLAYTLLRDQTDVGVVDWLD